MRNNFSLSSAIFKKTIVTILVVFALTSLWTVPMRAGPLCNKFDPVPSPLSSQWIACPDASNVELTTSNSNSIGGAADYYLHATDKSGSSVICSAPTNPMLGDWSKIGNCTEFCFDAQAFDNYDGTLRTMSIEINSGMSKRFVFAFTLAADKMSVDGKWHHFCVPIKPIASGAPLPSTAQGSWAPRTGTLASDWNAMLSNVKEIRLPIDMTKSPSEVMAYDNLCLNGTKCADEATVKTFTKTASRVCDKVTYVLHVEIESQGAVPQQVKISDIWPAGLLPATSVSISGNPTLTPTTSITPSGWTMTFPTASGSGSVNGSYDITFTSQIDPAVIALGDIKLTNQATLKLGKEGQPIKSDDPAIAGPADPTIVIVTSAEIKECTQPPVKSCLDGKAEVTCGKIPGTYNIIIKPNGAGGVIPTSVTITPITPGITLSPAKMNYPVIGGQVQVTVVGAHAGDVLEFDVSGTTTGGGSVSGSDLCCNGKIKVEIPKDLPCKDLIPVDLAIKKTGATSPAPEVPFYTFDLAVTNEGPAYSAAIGALTVTDVVPVGMVFNSVTAPAGWSCSPNTNVPAGTTITCHNTIAMNLPAGPGAPVATIKIVAKALGQPKFPPFTNCADVALQPGSGASDSVPLNNHSCVTVDKKPKTHVEIEKTCEPAHLGKGDFVAPKWEAICHIKVTTTGVITQPISISESFNGTGSVNYVSSADPWACSPLSSTMPAPLNCTLPANTLLGPTNVSIIDVKVIFPNIPPIKPITNCASGTYNHHSIDPSCVPIIVEQKSTIKINKICDPVTEVIGAINHFEAKCHITVTTTGPQSGAIVVSEAMTNGTVISATAPAPWACTTANCNINGSLLNQTSSASVIDVVVKINPGEKSARNCARLSQTGTNPIESCADIVVDPKKADLEIVKTGFKDCIPNAPCPFTISVTSIGQPYNGNVLLYDGLTPNLAWPVTSIVPNVCGASITTMPFGCVANLNLAANVPFTFTVTLNPLTVNALTQNENCISVATVGPNVPTGPMSAADMDALQYPNLTGLPKQSCWKLTVEPPKDLGNLTVIKEALYNGNHITSQSFPAKVTCGSTITPITVTDGTPYVQSSLPLGSTCSVVEQFTAPAAGLCPKNTMPRWSTSYDPATPVAVAATGTTITITNKLMCDPTDVVPRNMYVKKVVVNNAPGSVAGMIFDIGDQCTNTNQPPGFAHFVDGQTVLFHHYDPGMICNLSEKIPATTACGKDTPVWTTTYSPSQTVALATAGETVTVTNTLDCKPKKQLPIIDVPPVLKCDAATAKLIGDQCRCIIQGMVPVSKTSCACPDGMSLKNGSCRKDPPPPPVCKGNTHLDRATGRCVQNELICPPKTHKVGQRCVADIPDCPRGTHWNGRRCEPNIPNCPAPSKWNGKRCVEPQQPPRNCPPGMIKLGRVCIPIARNCPFGTMPTPLGCIGIGGGGRPPPRTDGGAVPGL